MARPGMQRMAIAELGQKMLGGLRG